MKSNSSDSAVERNELFPSPVLFSSKVRHPCPRSGCLSSAPSSPQYRVATASYYIMNTWLLLSLVLQWHCIAAENGRPRTSNNGQQLRSHSGRKLHSSKAPFSWQDIPMDIKNFWSSLTGKRGQSGTKITPNIISEEDGYAYMVVKVNSDAGRDVLFDLFEVDVLKELPIKGYTAIRVADEHLDAILEQLESDPNIESYEEDSIYTEQGTLEYFETEDEAHRRQLEDGETIPYGIIMSEGDKVPIGSDPVTVCIIDTGVARAHPDMNTDLLSGENRVSDVDSSMLQWYNDTRGHGTHVSSCCCCASKDITVFLL